MKNYELTAPAILVPREGHTRRFIPDQKALSRRASGFSSARDVLARDIKELRRVYGSQGLPNSSLRELIDMNKRMYPTAFIK